MQKPIINSLLSLAIISLSLSIGTYQAQSATARVSITKLSYQGFQHCKEFDRAGKSAYTGVVRGLTLDSNARTNGRRFSIRDCFSSKGQCEQFVGNINRIVNNVDSVSFRKCSPR